MAAIIAAGTSAYPRFISAESICNNIEKAAKTNSQQRHKKYKHFYLSFL